MKHFDDILRYLRPSMLQHLLRRLVFDVPILNEYAKMPLKVWLLFNFIVFVLFFILFDNNRKWNRIEQKVNSKDN